ncbi:hypothetical protein GCM10010915_00110 [Microbacterium faecale]|uniref:YdbS-like PH domain-containing protein n=1 Tax=Microbacterium faecale TaxID=1804630 RepID=A0A916XZJ5_9MICO|nr:PH domain-containing protein [Microbacterium faecale]GGD24096.1 hypothetical protein GCM10010915_00110 [Microbacterium faecale]
MSVPADPQQQPAEAVLPGGGNSNLADGEWHRLHPLTPLFKGGLVIVILFGVVIANLRDRLIFIGIGIFAPDEVQDDIEFESEDPISWALDWTFANNMMFLAAIAIVLVVAAFVVGYWLVWRFQQFRITDENVEVKKGIIFRSQRRAPLDRVQGVNLTRPFPARLIGMAKLTLEGAGTGADVALEYLATNRAESVRADILRLASGARQQRAQDRSSGEQRESLSGTVSSGVSDIIGGVEQDDVAPETVVRIPLGRLIGSHAITGAMWMVFFLVVIGGTVLVPIAIFEDGPDRWIAMLIAGLSTAIPMIIAAVAVVWNALQKGFRYSIAPTPDGVRISSGLLTTVSRTIPPGRVHAVEITQNLLWRPFGWWSIRINRMGGTSAAQQNSSQAQAAAIILPVGTRADVERVASLLLPHAPEGDELFVWQHGMLGPQENDPFTTTPKRAFIWHWLQRGRLGVRVTNFALLVRRGRLGRRLAIFPLARLQGVGVSQGVIARNQRLGHLRVHTVPGPVSGAVSSLDVDDAQRLADVVSRGAMAAANSDQTHRWAEVS